MYNRLIIIVLALLCGAKASAQYPEWVWDESWNEGDSAYCMYFEPYELSDGRILLAGENVYKDECDYYKWYLSWPELMSLSPDGTELARKQYGKEGYYGRVPHVLESSSGDVYIIITYSPDHDTCSSNHFKNFDPPTDHCIFGLYKLDDDLSIAESHEIEIPIDTFEWRNEDNPFLYYRCGQVFLVSAFVDDDGHIVGVYTKTVSFDRDEPRGNDSTVFFRMDFEGNIINRASYCGGYYMGTPPSWLYCRHHLVKEDNLYLFYGFPYAVVSENQNNLVYLDHDFNVVRTRYFRHPSALHPFNNDFFQNMNVMRSPHGTTYVTSSISERDYAYCCVLYEYDDDVNGGESTPIARYVERKNDVYPFMNDWIAYYNGVDLLADQSLYFAYSLHAQSSLDPDSDSWIVMEHLTPEFDTISTLFFGSFGDGRNYSASAIKATADGGLVLVSLVVNMYNDIMSNAVNKYPADAFDGIEEAHAYGLKTAITYPNPGQDVLNIRTGLKNAYMEVYDASGRQVHSQALTGGVTTIHAEAWPAGMYVWKVYANGKEAESGRWVKE